MEATVSMPISQFRKMEGQIRDYEKEGVRFVDAATFKNDFKNFNQWYFDEVDSSLKEIERLKKRGLIARIFNW